MLLVLVLPKDLGLFVIHQGCSVLSNKNNSQCLLGFRYRTTAIPVCHACHHWKQGWSDICVSYEAAETQWFTFVPMFASYSCYSRYNLRFQKY